MRNYPASTHPDILELHRAYAPDFPEFIRPFLAAPEMVRLADVSQHCGVEYGKLSKLKATVSRLDHSVGVALIVWRFTRDVRQTLAGLFHDVSHTAFSHVGDYLLGDFENQTSSEKYGEEILANSAVVRAELAKLGIPLDDVKDYSKYPVCENDLPSLSADRLEYLLHTLRLGQEPSASLGRVARIYGDMAVLKDARGVDELGFRTPELALEFARFALECDRNIFTSVDGRMAMGVLSEILRRMISAGEIVPRELYSLTDGQAIVRIKESKAPKVREAWDFFVNDASYHLVESKPETDAFCVQNKNKLRCPDPLAATSAGARRVSELFPEFRDERAAYLASPPSGWIVTSFRF